MAIISVNPICMLYFSIAVIFILFVVIHNENASATASSKINSIVTKFVMFQAVAVALLAVINISGRLLYLNDELWYILFRLSWYTLVQVISFVFAFYFYALLKRYIGGKHFLSSPGRKFIFISFVLGLAATIVSGALYGYDLYKANGQDVESIYEYVFRYLPLWKMMFYIAAIKDLDRFFDDLLKNSFVSPKLARSVEWFFIVGLIVGVPLTNFTFLPFSLAIVTALVFCVQLLSQEIAVSLDFLTGLNNRKELMRYLSRLFEKKEDLDKNLSIIFIDINDFKGVNDTYGHSQGDKALLALSSCLKKAAFSANCFICRYAGDEFTVVLRESPDKTVEDYKQALLQNLKEYNESKKVEFELSVSIGQVAYSEKYQNVNEFVKAADQNMYEQKEALKRSQSQTVDSRM